MPITPEEKKKRQAVLDKESQAVAELNDLSKLRQRIRDEKTRYDERVEESEEQKKKIARPSADSQKSP